MPNTIVVGDSVEGSTNQAAPATTAPAATSAAPGNPSAEADAAQANRSSGGFGEWLSGLWAKIQEFLTPFIDWISSFFEPNTNDHAAAAATPAAVKPPQTTPDARTLEEARAAANGNAAAGTGAEVASAATPTTLPVAEGARVQGALG